MRIGLKLTAAFLLIASLVGAAGYLAQHTTQEVGEQLELLSASAIVKVAGTTEIKRWTWNHVVFVRDGQAVRVHLNGRRRPEIQTSSPADFPVPFDEVFFGGRCDNQSNWEGRLDEVAVFDRALSVDEIEQLASHPQ